MADMQPDGVVALLQLEGILVAVGVPTSQQLFVVIVKHPQLGLEG